MKCLNLLTILSILLALNTHASELIIPEGKFACAVTYTESYDIQVVEGEDFPRFLGHLDRPRVRSEVLNLVFKNDKGELGIKLSNPEALPNWLLVNESQYENQQGYGSIDEENREIFYQVSWNQTWYFGSGIDVITKAYNGRILKVELRFNDNDSVGELHEWVKCIRK